MATIQDPEQANAALCDSLSTKLKLNVAEAMADYHEKVWPNPQPQPTANCLVLRPRGAPQFATSPSGYGH